MCPRPAFVDPSSHPADTKGKALPDATVIEGPRPVSPFPVDEPVPLVTHTLWLAVPDSDEFMARLERGAGVVPSASMSSAPRAVQVPQAGYCMTSFMSNTSTTHAALGVPWLQMLPNSVLEQRGSILLRDLTRHVVYADSVSSMSKYLTNVRYTRAVDVHYPFLVKPFALLDEGRWRTPSRFKGHRFSHASFRAIQAAP